MKPNFTLKLATLLLLFATLLYQPSTAFAQNTTFTYQGRLNSGGVLQARQTSAPSERIDPVG